jgi:opacity protein-like surface antigen
MTGEESETLAGVHSELAHFIPFAGARKTWDYEGVSPYVAAGLEADRANLTVTAGGVEVSDADVAFGGYLRAGVQFDVVPEHGVFLALEVRRGGIGSSHSSGKLGVNVDSDYSQVTALLGFRY